MKEHTCNTYIVKSNMDPKRVKSYNQIKLCMCMDVWGIYMVANLILLCSLKTYLSFGTWKNNFARKPGYLIHLSFFFLGGHRSTHCFKYLGHLFFFQYFFFMNNFCIATCLFSVTKLLRDGNKNLEHLFRGYPMRYIFGVHS
jgi:hypothetical protein